MTGWTATFEDMPGNPYWTVGNPDGALPRLVFVQVSTPKPSKNRVHLDLIPGGRQADEMDRLLSLGAGLVEDRRGLEPGGWVVLSDIEGNEFCLEGGEVDVA